ncbi:hypothetical protein DM02DRAFT_158708 [Periconia macrospinosa]|uniref:DNA polymerase delta subunit 3 n=1 Tax=Periconia macrospinosa TaxID=97972 RepID=A0A2V1E248_9PLEO|nr:hypothetical protein DM02DRAFT_158708 [Periconia macrospinosa]
MPEQNYKEYLAARLLAENRPVTYRLLSRAVKVHVNRGKQMLYEFHRNQNAKKPRSIHATYLITGKKRTSEHTNGLNGKDGEDAVMQDSPFPSSLPGTQEPDEKPVSTTSIVLVREEELEKTKAEFVEVTSIHIYSLEPGPIEDLGVLSLCNEEVATKFTKEDPLERWQLYGCIHNPHIKRRTPKSGIAASKTTSKPAAKPTAKPQPKELIPAVQTDSKPSASNTKTSTSAAPKATLQRSNSTKSNPPKKTSVGDLFKSFAKTKPPKPKESEDSPMGGMSEDEGEDSEPESGAPKVDEAKLEAARKEKEARKEELLKMMEEDVDMADAATPQDTNADEVSQDANDDAPLDSQDKAEPAESEEPVVAAVAGGRRRGRRRVTKRKKVKDADGYLVTKEETVWESFSEDEKPPEPKKLKPVPNSSAKGGKKGAPKGQGSIASFFKKA